MISGLFTAAALLGFLGICLWAYLSRSAQRDFAEAERLPLDDASAPPGDSNQQETDA